uniref:Ubiquitin-like-conjugating enzyme ATG10 n=1 Tax=Steinernema glaseri TaxID=37863 RepID=A0A1I8A2W7_9BILA
MTSTFAVEGIDPVEDTNSEDSECSQAPSTSEAPATPISKEQFLDNIKKISQVTCRSFDAGEHWIVESIYGTSHLTNTSLLQNSKTGASVERSISMTFSETYQVPVFWFSYKVEGSTTMLYLEDLEKELDCAALKWNSAVKEGMHTSLLEHPITGQFMYQCHPCETDKLMVFAKGSKNYVVSWMSYMCSQFAIPFDYELGSLVV